MVERSVLPEFKLHHNTTCDQSELLDFLTNIALAGDFTNNDAKIRRLRRK